MTPLWRRAPEVEYVVAEDYTPPPQDPHQYSPADLVEDVITLLRAKGVEVEDFSPAYRIRRPYAAARELLKSLGIETRWRRSGT